MALDKTLRSIYLRLDVNMQYLTGNAIAQIIVKLIQKETERKLQLEITKF